MIDFVIISLYLVVILGVAFYFGLRTKTMRDYSVANKSYSTPIMVAAMVGTTIGGGATLGGAELVFRVGIIGALVSSAFVIELIITAVWVVPRLAQFKDAISPGDVMERFYGKPGRVFTGIAGTFKCVASIGGQVFAISLLLQHFFGVSHLGAVIVGAVVVAFYSALGGIKTVTFTDVIQFVVLVIAIPTLCNLGLVHIGGYASLFSRVPSSHLSLLPDDATNLKYLSLFIIGALPTLSPAIFQRLLVAKDTKQLRISVWLDACVVAGIFSIVSCIGFIALVLKPDLNSNMAMPYLIDTILPQGVRSLVLIGMVAVIMSMADSYLNVAGITFVHDVVKPLCRKPLADRTELRVTQIATFCFGIAGVGVALYLPNIFTIVVKSRSLWVPLITVPLLAGLSGLAPSRRTFFVGMFAGATGGITWYLFFEKDFGLDNIFVGLLSNAVAFFVAHAFEKRQRKAKSNEPNNHFAVVEWISSCFLRAGKTATTFRLPLRKLLHFSSTRVEEYGAQYTAFGLFAPLIYIIPYVSWSNTDEALQSHTIILRFIGGFLAFYLVVRDQWPRGLKRYLPLYWHATLFYTLSFLMVFMVLESGASWESLSNMLLGIFLLGVLVDWLSFVIIMGLGATLATAAFATVGNFSALSIDAQQIQWIVYMYGFAIAIGMLFGRNKEKRAMDMLEELRSLGASTLHEAEFPLSTMNLTADGLAVHMPTLIADHEAAVRAGISVEPIPDLQLEALKKLPAGVKAVCKRSLSLNNMLLTQMKGESTISDSERALVSQSVEEALETFAFKSGERNLISWENKTDFEVRGPDALVHVIYNLIKNSLFQIKKAQRGSISIWTEKGRKEYRLHFKDTAAGINEAELDLIFKPFYSAERHGRGLGLHFCKKVMYLIGGNISCHSEHGVYTEFVLTFPVLEKIVNEKHTML
jgi:Na+/proline symporter/signal transduction histidine kinase